MEYKFDDEKTYTIKDLPLSERPREKLFNYGVESLSNIELLAIIIRTGSKDKSALDIAQEILYMDDRGFPYLAEVSISELTKISGIGRCKAAQIITAVEIGKRLNSWNTQDRVKITSPNILVNLMMDKMRYLKKEHFNIALLDTKNQIMSVENISIGTLNASIVHPRDVFNMAITKNANSIILLHNHPSGDISPSSEDINVTKRLLESGNLLGIKVLDHIIIGDNKYFSFKEEGLI